MMYPYLHTAATIYGNTLLIPDIKEYSPADTAKCKLYVHKIDEPKQSTNRQ